MKRWPAALVNGHQFTVEVDRGGLQRGHSANNLRKPAGVIRTIARAFVTAYSEAGQGAVVLINANDNSGALKRLVEAIAQQYQWPKP